MVKKVAFTLVLAKCWRNLLLLEMNSWGQVRLVRKNVDMKSFIVKVVSGIFGLCG